MSDWLMRVIKAEAKHLIALAAEDDELRADLRALAEEILAATEDPAAETESAPSESDSSATRRAGRSRETTSEADGRAAPGAHAWKVGGGQGRIGSRVRLRHCSRAGAAHDELAEIEARCRWKAEAARWAAERLLRSREGNDVP